MVLFVINVISFDRNSSEFTADIKQSLNKICYFYFLKATFSVPQNSVRARDKIVVRFKLYGIEELNNSRSRFELW